MTVTPGPYRAIMFGHEPDAQICRVGFVIVCEKDGLREIATTPPTFVHGDLSDADLADAMTMPLAELRANATMLAASPDMLVALQMLLGEIEAAPPNAYTMSGLVERMIRAAVTKATVPEPKPKRRRKP